MIEKIIRIGKFVRISEMTLIQWVITIINLYYNIKGIILLGTCGFGTRDAAIPMGSMSSLLDFFLPYRVYKLSGMFEYIYSVMSIVTNQDINILN